ncbi:MAG: carbon-nitrogen hydrolase family protein [Polyangiaceae bacterium]|nr:carbon-nitrogen hydrolase family protein [Polyangiaceae bacterium]
MRLLLVEPRLTYDDDRANREAIERALADASLTPGADDVLLLPERFQLAASPAEYEATVCGLARRLGCHLVGGSQHAQRDGAAVHRGLAVAPDGTVTGQYEKLRPYASERSVVGAGTTLGELRVAGRDVLVLICADFWFSDLLLAATRQPDLVVVPALSVSRKPSPDYSRAMWRHLCVTRAYELGVYVGVSDWSHDSTLPALHASGVSGLADPTQLLPEALFAPVAPARARAFSLDFEALEGFRQDRRDRGFFWTPGARPAPS